MTAIPESRLAEIEARCFAMGMSVAEKAELCRGYRAGRSGPVPDGWKLVPVVPTAAMVTAANEGEAGCPLSYVRPIYHAMLAAALSPPAIDTLAAVVAERDALRAFARRIMEVWPLGDVDGDDVQTYAVEFGLIKPGQRAERCGDSCFCAEYAASNEWPVTCYRRTALLTGTGEAK